MPNISTRTVTIFTHIQDHYINSHLPVINNCQRLARNPLAGRIFEHRSSYHPPVLEHAGQANKQRGMEYSLKDLDVDNVLISADHVILAGGSMLFPQKYYADIANGTVGMCHFNAYLALIKDLDLGEGMRERPVEIHFAADTIYTGAINSDEFDGELETTLVNAMPPLQPDILERYEAVLINQGIAYGLKYLGKNIKPAENPQAILCFWGSVDELFDYLAGGAEPVAGKLE